MLLSRHFPFDISQALQQCLFSPFSRLVASHYSNVQQAPVTVLPCTSIVPWSPLGRQSAATSDLANFKLSLRQLYAVTAPSTIKAEGVNRHGTSMLATHIHHGSHVQSSPSPLLLLQLQRRRQENAIAPSLALSQRVAMHDSLHLRLPKVEHCLGRQLYK